MTEYEEKLREYLKATKELRTYIETNTAGSYWNVNDNLFDFLGKTMHRVEVEIREERAKAKEKEEFDKMIKRIRPVFSQDLGLATSIEPPRCPNCGHVLYATTITSQCSCSSCDYQSNT